MKMIGQVIGILRDKDTLEVTNRFEGVNHVQESFIQSRITTLNLAKDGIGNLLFVSKQNAGRQRRDFTFNGVNSNRLYDEWVSVGTGIVGVTSPQYSYYQAGVHVKEIAQRFAAPAVDREINTIGVINQTSYYLTNQGLTPQAAITLSTPCIQTTTEILDVYYRIQVIYDENLDNNTDFTSMNTSTKEELSMSKALLGAADFPVINPNDPYTSFSTKTNPRNYKRNNPIATTLAPLDINGVGTYTLSSLNYRIGRNFNYAVSGASVGKIVGSLFIPGDSPTSNCMFGQLLIKDPANYSPVQSIVGHSSIATTPFYDSGTTQSGLGTMVIDGSAWTDPDFPKFLKIDVKSTGGLGVGTYKFKQRSHLGFVGNTYDNRIEELMGFHVGNSHYTDGFKIDRGYPLDRLYNDGDELRKCASCQKYGLEQSIISSWTDEIAIIDVLTQTGKRFAATTTPALPATLISQVSIDSSLDVWVACRNTGLYRIDSSQTLVESIVGPAGTTGCYGVTEGTTGRIWAFFAGTSPGLYYTDTNGSSWLLSSFNSTDVTGSESVVKSLQADPNEPAGHVAVMVTLYRTIDTNSLYALWYDLSEVVTPAGTAIRSAEIHGIGNTGVAPNSLNNYTGIYIDEALPITFSTGFKCSPTQHIWGTTARNSPMGTGTPSPAIFTFGTAGVTLSSNLTDFSVKTPWATTFITDDLGNEVLIGLSKKGYTGGLNTEIYSVVLFTTDSSGITTVYDPLPALTNVAGDGLELPICYLGSGMFMSFLPYTSSLYRYDNNTSAINIFSVVSEDSDTSILSNELFPEYGWDGANWVLGHAGERTFHATSEPLIDGLSISFDDNTGADTFNVNDFYTVSINNGVLIDGATTFDYEHYFYMLPSYADTDLQTAILPAVTKVPGALLKTDIAGSTQYQDNVGVAIGATNIYRTVTTTVDVYDGGARTILPVIKGVACQDVGLSRDTVSNLQQLQGYVRTGFTYSTGINWQMQLGLTPTVNLGNPLDIADLTLGIQFDNIPTVAADYRNPLITVVLNGVLTAITFTDIWVNNYTTTNEQFRFYVFTDGSCMIEINTNVNGWKVLYEAGPGTIPAQDYHFEVIFADARNAGLNNISYYNHPDEDYYLYLGNGVDTGAFRPEFKRIDSEFIEVLIDGLPAIQVADNDTDTVLPANTFSLFPDSGYIRYSASDAGKSISSNYITLAYE